MPKLSAAELEAGLAHFTGTEAYHRTTIAAKVLVTDGIKWLCENAGAFWLIDAIESHQPKCQKDPMLQEMQFWTLQRHPDGNGATLMVERDTNDVFYSQKITNTDFPLPEIKIWLEPTVVNLHGQERQVMIAMLPSER